MDSDGIREGDLGRPVFPDDTDMHLGRNTVPVSFMWPPETKHLWVTVRWGFVDDRWTCVGISVDFAPGARVRSLTRKDLAAVLRMGELLNYASAEFERTYRTLMRVFVTSVAPELEDSPRLSAEAFPRRRQRSRSPRLEEVAKTYNEARRKGDRKPTQAVAQRWDYTPNNAAQWVFRARKAGLIPPVDHAGLISDAEEEA